MGFYTSALVHKPMVYMGLAIRVGRTRLKGISGYAWHFVIGVGQIDYGTVKGDAAYDPSASTHIYSYIHRLRS